MSTLPVFTRIAWIGENRFGYKFGVGLADGRWLGFALGQVAAGERCVFFLHQVSDDIVMGCVNLDTALRLTSAVALDPDASYGGIDTWWIKPELRGDPEALRCLVCGEIGYHECEQDEVSIP